MLLNGPCPATRAKRATPHRNVEARDFRWLERYATPDLGEQVS